ncbi:Thiol-disulfide interchange protein, contains DsbC and DsbD domains [Devosia enhydra]|uniref:Thiol-disulfide interchange protein, contains DsbC and DsbD domains n=1 Tax=Devosia enhydra TaxID=665118 RepID=A0A1K2I1B2_9HYPH|nr:protein-disulfide reductase DsbD domain-containing protein [Devosia enhydra]SFZ86113.1 Thiol-disulfide interchange protein, contains DsbC and DsbD domains [Devosia enhydra]
MRRPSAKSPAPRLVPSLVLLGSLLAFPASAGESPWHELAPGVSARLVSADRVEQGTLQAGVEITMPAGFNTYWRVPGETGIPTALDLSRSVNVEAHAIAWPYPERETAKGFVDYIYRDRLLLPLTLTLSGEPATLSVELSVGICSDICIPAQAALSLDLATRTADRRQALALTQAEALAPLPWPDAAPPVAILPPGDDSKLLRLRVDPDRVDVGSIIVDLGAGGPIFGVPQKSPEPDLVLVPMLGKKTVQWLAGRSVTVTFITPQGAYEISQSVPQAESTVTPE